MWFLLACAPPDPTVTAPTATTWAQEGQLVVDGLERAEAIWNTGDKDAAAQAAEHVYTDRWEPRLEPAMRQLSPASDVISLEYAFGQLLVDMRQGSRETVASRVDEVERKVRAVAEAATAAFPPPGTEAKPTAAPGTVVRPIVPDVKPNWEKNGGG